MSCFRRIRLLGGLKGVQVPAVLLLLGLAALPGQAQFWERLTNPDITVTLTHPPSLGINLKRVAFAPVTSNDAEELVSACIADLSKFNTIELIDRNNVQQAMKELRFGQSANIDQASAVEMGKMLGSPVLLIVKVFGLKVTNTPLHEKGTYTDKQGRDHTTITYISKSTADFRASIQAVDLATGNIFGEKRFASNPSLQNKSTEGPPEYPMETEVREKAIQDAVRQLRKMLLPWDERRKLIYYDDKDYGMKEAFKRLQLNDNRGALERSLESLKNAKADANAEPKYLARTNYNVGMSHFILGDYDESIKFLRVAREFDASHSIFRESEQECLRAISLRDSMKATEVKTLLLETAARSAAKAAEAPPPPPVKAPEAPRAADSIEDRLRKLEDLRKKGFLTLQEYQMKKAEILKDM